MRKKLLLTFLLFVTFTGAIFAQSNATDIKENEITTNSETIFNNIEGAELNEAEMMLIEGGSLKSVIKATCIGLLSGAASGAALGAYTGAAGGTMFLPGVGTVAGAASCALAGAVGGIITGTIGGLITGILTQ